MAEKELQTQIDQINQKLDLLLEYVNQQRLKSEATDDLVSDLSIIAKDAYQSTVTLLDNKGVELDMDEVRQFLIGIIKNIPNINKSIGMMESMFDLMQDLAPIAREMMIDFIHNLHELEQRGLFEYIKQMRRAMIVVSDHYTPEDMGRMVDNLPVLLKIIKNLSDPSVLQAAEKATRILAETSVNQELDKKSIFTLMKELNSPEVRSALGYSLRFIKAMNNEQ